MPPPGSCRCTDGVPPEHQPPAKAAGRRNVAFATATPASSTARIATGATLACGAGARILATGAMSVCGAGAGILSVRAAIPRDDRSGGSPFPGRSPIDRQAAAMAVFRLTTGIRTDSTRAAKTLTTMTACDPARHSPVPDQPIEATTSVTGRKRECESTARSSGAGTTKAIDSEESSRDRGGSETSTRAACPDCARRGGHR